MADGCALASCGGWVVGCGARCAPSASASQAEPVGCLLHARQVLKVRSSSSRLRKQPCTAWLDGAVPCWHACLAGSTRLTLCCPAFPLALCRACSLAGCLPEEAVHVGDSLLAGGCWTQFIVRRWRGGATQPQCCPECTVARWRACMPEEQSSQHGAPPPTLRTHICTAPTCRRQRCTAGGAGRGGVDQPQRRAAGAHRAAPSRHPEQRAGVAFGVGTAAADAAAAGGLRSVQRSS